LTKDPYLPCGEKETSFPFLRPSYGRGNHGEQIYKEIKKEAGGPPFLFYLGLKRVFCN
jgi:hypothetical protein